MTADVAPKIRAAVAEALERVEYKHSYTYERSFGRGFVAHNAYLDGKNIWYQREYGLPPRGFDQDPRDMAKATWLLNNQLSLDIWTATNLPLRALEAAAKKHKGYAEPHFYGPEGYGFLGFHSEEAAMAFVLSGDYEKWKGEYDEDGETPLASRISEMLGGKWVRSWKDWLGVWFRSKDEVCTYVLAEPSRGGLSLLKGEEKVGSISAAEVATFDELNDEPADKSAERAS